MDWQNLGSWWRSRKFDGWSRSSRRSRAARAGRCLGKSLGDRGCAGCRGRCNLSFLSRSCILTSAGRYSNVITFISNEECNRITI